ncbi:MAG: MFS transporter, partial [Mesorhizobium sp.]
MPERSVLRKAIWALGLTQIIGYGTLYYSFSILAPAMAGEFGLTEGWVFGALSASLFAGSLFAPTAGRWADRFGAGRIMTVGSVAAAVALALCAVAPDRVSFVLALREPIPEAGAPLDPRRGRAVFLLMLAGFATEGFVLSAILIHMVPLTAALGLGTAGLFVSTLFGPAQVASRLINMLFGGRLQQTHLAVIAASLLTAGLCALLLTTPW